MTLKQYLKLRLDDIRKLDRKWMFLEKGIDLFGNNYKACLIDDGKNGVIWYVYNT